MKTRRPRQTKRTILHVDMDAFFAAIELLHHPELQGKAVVVGGSGGPRQRGVVSTASYEARQYGIHSGMALRLAFELCPEAVLLPVDYRSYARVSKKIKSILHIFSRHIEEVGLDEAFLDLTGSERPSPEQTAQRIKERIRKETGLTCSVGIGPNKLLAKIASDLEKPDGLTQLTFKDIPHRVWPLPVREIWGVGTKTEERLTETDVTTIGELAALQESFLIKLFGQARGHYLYNASHGRDEGPVVASRKRKSIGHEITFQHDVIDPRQLSLLLAELGRKVVGRLRQYHYRAATVMVKLRYTDFETYTRSITLSEATDELTPILDAVQGCFLRHNPDKSVRLIGIRLSRLQTHIRMQHAKAQ